VGDVSYADGETQRDASSSKIHVNDAGTCATFLSGGGWFEKHESTEVIFVDLVTGDAELISAIDGSGTSAGGGTDRVAFGVSHPFADRQVLSSDCNKVVFQSSLELTPGAKGKHAYVRNRSKSSTTLISSQFQAESSPSISGDGNLFAFVGEGEANFLDLFDITIIQVSEPVVITGSEQHASWFNPYAERLFLDELDMTSADSIGVGHMTLSADGTHVLLRSSGTAGLGLPESNAPQLMVGNLVDNTVELATVTPDGAPLSYTNEESSISGDGRYVAYVSADSHAVAGLPEGIGAQVYLRDLENDTTVLVSKTSDGTPLDRGARTVEVSDDGHYVIYSTGSSPIYRYEIATDDTLTIDPVPAGESLDCSNPGASADGKTIVFYCYGGGPNSYTPEQEMPWDKTAGLYVFRDE
jgi:WD40-like Beta Propeller Repeat